MTPGKVKEILRLHAMWIRNEHGGIRAVLRGANLRDADLSGANLTDADLRGANLRDADLRDADLSFADLGRANLTDADLRDAVLRDADLSGANLRDADLSGANLRHADLSGADLSGAKSILAIGPMPISGRIIYAWQHAGKTIVQYGYFWGSLEDLDRASQIEHVNTARRAAYAAAIAFINAMMPAE